MNKHWTLLLISVITVLVVLLACSSTLPGQARWFPSRWGADDQRGAANRLTPAKVLEARDLIKTGQIYPLGHVYENGMPMFGTRHYSLRIPQAFNIGEAITPSITTNSSVANLARSARSLTVLGTWVSEISSTTATTATTLPNLKGS
jgi:hypothetical protein